MLYLIVGADLLLLFVIVLSITAERRWVESEYEEWKRKHDNDLNK